MCLEIDTFEISTTYPKAQVVNFGVHIQSLKLNDTPSQKAMDILQSKGIAAFGHYTSFSDISRNKLFSFYNFHILVIDHVQHKL